MIINYHQNYFSKNFIEKLNKTLLEKINEIPKEYFTRNLFDSVNFSSYRLLASFFDILEDVSLYENVKNNTLENLMIPAEKPLVFKDVELNKKLKIANEVN